MSRYCVDFQTGVPDWQSVGAFEQMPDSSFDCTRGWVVIQNFEFYPLNPALSSGSTFTTEEVAALKAQAANPSVLNLSPSEGTLVGGAIVLTWAAAWGVKALIRALNVDGDFEK